MFWWWILREQGCMSINERYRRCLQHALIFPTALCVLGRHCGCIRNVPSSAPGSYGSPPPPLPRCPRDSSTLGLSRCRGSSWLSGPARAAGFTQGCVRRPSPPTRATETDELQGLGGRARARAMMDLARARVARQGAARRMGEAGAVEGGGRGIGRTLFSPN